jgi:hypothetical protein
MSPTKFGVLALEAGYRLHIEVLQSGRGFYIGTADSSGPVSRESLEYFNTEEQAVVALKSGNWTQKDYL